MTRTAQQSTNIIVPIVLLFVIGVTVVFALTFWNAFSSHSLFDAYATVKAEVSVGLQTWDIASLIVYVGLLIGLGVTTFNIKSHPVYFVVDIILLFFFLFSVSFISDLQTQVMDSAQLSSVSLNFPVISFMRDNYPLLTLINFFVFALGLYAKGRSNSIGGNYF